MSDKDYFRNSKGNVNYIHLFSFIIFYISLSMYVGIYVGIVMDIKKNHDIIAGLDETGHKKRQSIYNLLITQTFLSYTILICADILSNFTGSGEYSWMSSISMMIFYSASVSQFYLFTIHPGYDTMLCNINTFEKKDKSFTDLLGTGRARPDNKTNSEYYDEYYDQDPLKHGRSFYRTAKKQNESTNYKEYMNELIDDLRMNANMTVSNEQISKFLSKMIKNEELDELESKLKDRLSMSELDHITSMYIVENTYFDGPDYEYGVIPKKISKDDINNSVKLIENIDEIKKQNNVSDSFVLRSGLMGGSLLSVLNLLDTKYESVNKGLVKNEYNYKYLLGVYYGQLLVFVISYFGGFSSLVDLFMTVKKAYRERTLKDATITSKREFEASFKKAKEDFKNDLDPSGKVKLTDLTVRHLQDWVYSGGGSRKMRQIYKDILDTKT